MSRRLHAREFAPLPVLAEAETLVSAAVSVAGQVLVSARALPATGGPLRVFRHDGDGIWWPVTTAVPPSSYPHLDLLPDGDLLVVEARARRGEPNAHVYDWAGTLRRAFRLGDAVAHAGVDAAGRIWVGYGEEGIYADPLAAEGLARFDHDGQRLWRYHPPWGAGGIADCYALNVDARTVWAYYYSGFPLVEIVGDHRARAYVPTPVRGAGAVVVYRDDVVFVGEYGDPLRLACCRRTGGSLRHDGAATIVTPDGARLPSFEVVATRGSRLYLRTGTHVLLVDLADPDNRPR